MIIWLIFFILIATFYWIGSSPFNEHFQCQKGWQATHDQGVVQNNGIPTSIQCLPEGLDQYPPQPVPPQGKPKPPLWKWQSYLKYFDYDPYWAYSSPYNQLCDAFARRNCNNAWDTRDCFRTNYDKCITDRIY